MTPRQVDSATLKLRVRCLLTFAFPLTLIALTAACGGLIAQNQSGPVTQSNPTASPTATPTPKPTATPRMLLEGIDEPIIVSGGSLDLMFNPSTYLPVEASSPEAKQFKSADRRIKLINVFKDDAEDSGEEETLCSPGIQEACADGNCRVVVKYKKNGNQTITIDSSWTPALKHVQIEFSTLKLLRRLTKRAHSSKGAKITAIEYHTTSGATSGLTRCDVGRHTTVEIDTCAINPMACPSP